jgi:4-hydroxybenzoate polyprenyltransferase
MKKPALFWIGSVLNILMIPLFFFNVLIAIIVGIIGFLIARSSGCTFEDFK